MWLNIAAKLVPGMIKTGMSIASNRRRTKELEEKLKDIKDTNKQRLEHP